MIHVSTRDQSIKAYVKFGRVWNPCRRSLCQTKQENERLDVLLATSFLALSRIPLANKGEPETLSGAGKADATRQGKASWTSKSTKRALCQPQYVPIRSPLAVNLKIWGPGFFFLKG